MATPGGYGRRTSNLMQMPVPPIPRLALRAPSRRAVLVCVATLALLGLGFLWLRDSSLVSVDRVTVTGASGPDAERIRAALEAAARDMTTLRVRTEQLRTAVEPFSSVKGLDVATDFPHGLRIVVHERAPVAAIVAGDQRVAVAADGTLLRDEPTAGLVSVSAKVPPGGKRLTDARLLRAVAVIATAPATLRAKLRRVYLGPEGLTAPLERGPQLYFGDARRLTAKWIAATTVLADPSSGGATYIDVRVPERPAAGGLEQPPTEVPKSAVQASGEASQASQATGGG